MENITYERLRSNISLNCFFIDKLQSGEGNINDVIDDMERVANDWFILLTQQEWIKDYFIIQNARSQPIADRLKDNIAGWLLEFTMLSNTRICLNDLPISGTVPSYEKCRVDGEIGNIIYIGNNNMIADSGYSFDDIVFKGNIPTHLSQLQDDATHRLVTDTEKSIWNNISKYKGVYTSLQSLISGVSNPQAGDWAHVDEGNNTDIKLYIYDATDNKWVLSAAGGNAPEIDPIFNNWLSTFQQLESKGCSFDGNYTLIPVNSDISTIIEDNYMIIEWYIMGYDVNGDNCTITLDILKNNISLCGNGIKPHLNNALKNSNNTSSWNNNNVSNNDIITYKVISNNNCVFVNLVLKLRRI